jgi:hypothetical protein
VAPKGFSSARHHSFTGLEAGSPEQLLISELGVIDVHHGEYSSDPRYCVIHVVGAKCSEDVERELAVYGFTFSVQTNDGFEANRL